MDIFKGMPYGIKEIITNRMIASVAISPTGAIIPLLDTAAITAIWANMLYEIAKYHDVTLTTEECTKIITACGSCSFLANAFRVAVRIFFHICKAGFLSSRMHCRKFILKLLLMVGTFFYHS